MDLCSGVEWNVVFFLGELGHGNWGKLRFKRVRLLKFTAFSTSRSRRVFKWSIFWKMINKRQKIRLEATNVWLKS